MEVIKLTSSQLRVSSTLNRDSQSYGKQYLVDEKDETCWCSDQGSPQWIAINLDQILNINKIHLQFQGGFVGKDCTLTLIHKDDEKTESNFYPEDSNLLQAFNFDNTTPCKKIIINFKTSTDIFGRIIVYKLLIS